MTKTSLLRIATGSFIMMSIFTLNMEVTRAETATKTSPGSVKSLIEKYEGKTARPSEANKECEKAIAEMNEKNYSQPAKDYVLSELKCNR